MEHIIVFTWGMWPDTLQSQIVYVDAKKYTEVQAKAAAKDKFISLYGKNIKPVMLYFYRPEKTTV